MVLLWPGHCHQHRSLGGLDGGPSSRPLPGRLLGPSGECTRGWELALLVCLLLCLSTNVKVPSLLHGLERHTRKSPLTPVDGRDLLLPAAAHLGHLRTQPSITRDLRKIYKLWEDSAPHPSSWTARDACSQGLRTASRAVQHFQKYHSPLVSPV